MLLGTTRVCPLLHLDSLIRFVQLIYHHRAWISLSYSPVGANVHPHLIRELSGLYESAPKQHIDRFIRFCKAHGRHQQTDTYRDRPRSSAIAEGPRDASCQLKSCQMPRNSAETTYTTSPDQIDGMKLEI